MIAIENLHPQYLKAEDGASSFVVLPVNEFETLLEDYNDLTVIEERRNEPNISLSELKQNLANYANV